MGTEETSANETSWFILSQRIAPTRRPID